MLDLNPEIVCAIIAKAREFHAKEEVVIPEEPVNPSGDWAVQVLPGGLGDTEKVLAFIAQEVSRNTYVNIMDQYHPCYRADEYPPLDRPLTSAEYRHALQLAAYYGLQRLDRRH